MDCFSRLAWEGLSDMPKEKAMEEFCSLMEKLAPELEAFLEAQYRDAEEKKRKKLEEKKKRRRRRRKKKKGRGRKSCKRKTNNRTGK